MRVTVSVESSSSEVGTTVDGGADIEAGTSTKAVAALKKTLRRYTRRQSEVYAEATHLVISVEDSGAGISTVCTCVCVS